jgi:hypothetical protein
MSVLLSWARPFAMCYAITKVKKVVEDGGEYTLVKAFVAPAAIERFDERILHRLPWYDVVPVERSERPAQHGCAGQLTAIIAARS